MSALSQIRRGVRASLRRQEGQGMTEYILIVALIAIAAIGVVTVFGNDITELFTDTTSSLSGNTNVTNTAKKNTHSTKKTIANFGTDNKGN